MGRMGYAPDSHCLTHVCTRPHARTGMGHMGTQAELPILPIAGWALWVTPIEGQGMRGRGWGHAAGVDGAGVKWAKYPS